MNGEGIWTSVDEDPKNKNKINTRMYGFISSYIATHEFSNGKRTKKNGRTEDE